MAWSLRMTASPRIPRVPVTIRDDARRMGTHLVGGKGSGKSRMMARLIAARDFLSGVPTIIFDPHGPTIDNFLDRLTYLPVDVQRKVTQRLLYADMSGKSGYVPGFPLYYRQKGDSLRTVARRFLEITRKLDPSLVSAPIMGWNALDRVGTNAGMILAALGLQVLAAPDLLRRTEGWIPRLAELGEHDLEARPAVRYFVDEYLTFDAERRQRESEAFLGKIQPFTHDISLQAMFGTATSTINWDRVVRGRYAILLDFRHEADPRFKILWTLTNFLDYVKRRGPTRAQPISVIIDELAYLLALNSSGHDLLSQDMDELINKVARNNNLWLTLAHQEMYQVPEKIQKTLMTMGTQIIGVTTDEEAALALSKRFRRYDPYWVKKYEPIRERGQVIDYRSTEYSPTEQTILGSRLFSDLRKFRFQVAVSEEEGSVGTRLREISIDWLDPGQYVNEPMVNQIRQGLAKRCGLPIKETAQGLQNELSDVLSKLRTDQPPRAPAPARSSHPSGVKAATEHEGASPSADDNRLASTFVLPPRSSRRKSV